MKKQDIFNKARLSLRDEKRVEYSDDELESYLYDAVGYLSTTLATLHSSYTRKKVWVTSCPMQLPKDYLVSDTCRPDARYYNDYIKFDALPTEFEYYHKYLLPKRIDEDILIPDEFTTALTQSVINRALLRNEYSTNVEQQDNQRFYGAIVEIVKIRDGVIRNAEKQAKYQL